jgi:hypothetical protein
MCEERRRKKLRKVKFELLRFLSPKSRSSKKPRILRLGKNITVETFFKLKNCFFLLLGLQCRTFRLQVKPLVFQGKHLALQNIKFLPNPDPLTQSNL